MKLRGQYKLNKEAKVGETCVCPSCNTEFKKTNYQQAFCRTKRKTWCKDKYWNTVTPEKRNNTTRISPASARWMEKQREINDSGFRVGYDDVHPFSSEGLGQWEY